MVLCMLTPSFQNSTTAGHYSNFSSPVHISYEAAQRKEVKESEHRVRSEQVSDVHGHLIYLRGVVLLNVPQNLDVVVLHKVDGHTLQSGEQGGGSRGQQSGEDCTAGLPGQH